MIFKCPGSHSFSQPHPEIIKCHFCSAEVEIWSDEVKATCISCKKIITREQAQSCLEWCKYAKDCVGDEVLKKYQESRSEQDENKRGAV